MPPRDWRKLPDPPVKKKTDTVGPTQPKPKSPNLPQRSQSPLDSVNRRLPPISQGTFGGHYPNNAPIPSIEELVHGPQTVVYDGLYDGPPPPRWQPPKQRSQDDDYESLADRGVPPEDQSYAQRPPSRPPSEDRGPMLPPARPILQREEAPSPSPGRSDSPSRPAALGLGASAYVSPSQATSLQPTSRTKVPTVPCGYAENEDPRHPTEQRTPANEFRSLQQ